jgi:hypothetical protein
MCIARFFEDEVAAPSAIGYHDVGGMKPCYSCDVISVVAEFVVDVGGMKPCYSCDVISVVAEFMVDVGGMKSCYSCDQYHTLHLSTF